MEKIPLVVIVGPTASGKTELAIKIAENFGGEIVSADSMQIYKDIPIASAAPTPKETERIPHHLVSFLPLEHEYSVAEYVKDAKREIEIIHLKGKLPVIVGGTGLYIDSLINNISFSETKFDKQYREELNRLFDEIGGEEMLKRLSKFDKLSASALHKNDKKRIIRAFEIFKETGNTKERQNELSRSEPSPYYPIYIGINYKSREILYHRINERVDNMLKNGLVDEAKKTYNSSFGTAVQAIGHKEIYSYFNGEQTLEEATENLKKQTRHYAKRQLTWFNKNQSVNWIYADECEDVFSEAVKIIERMLNDENKTIN